MNILILDKIGNESLSLFQKQAPSNFFINCFTDNDSINNKLLKEAHILVSKKVKIDRQFIENSPHLKFIQLMTNRSDKIDKKIRLILNENEEEEFLISEIFLIGKNKKELNDKIIKVQESILEIGFNNTAIKYSSSDTSKNGGELGWVGESQISKKILGQIKLQVQEI